MALKCPSIQSRGWVRYMKQDISKEYEKLVKMVQKNRHTDALNGDFFVGNKTPSKDDILELGQRQVVCQIKMIDALKEQHLEIKRLISGATLIVLVSLVISTIVNIFV